jgi:hypothetical protein
MSDNIWIQDFNILFQKDRLMDFFPSKEQTNEERINSIVRLSFYSSVVLSMYYSNTKYLFIFVFVLLFTFMIYKHHPEMNPEHPKQITIRQKQEQKAQDQYNNPENLQTLNNFIPSAGIKSSVEGLENPPNTNNPDDPLKPIANKVYPGNCTKPTIENPFMNFTMADYMNLDSTGKIYDRPPACDPNDPEIKKQIDESFNNNLFKDINDVFGKMNSQRNYYSAPSTEIVNDRESFQKWLYLSPKTCKEDNEMCIRGNFEDLRSNSFQFPFSDSNPNNSEARAQNASDQVHVNKTR